MAFRDLIPWGRRPTEVARNGEGNPVLSLQREMNRAFDDFWRRFDEPFGALGWRNGGGLPSLAMPRTDVAETDDAIEVSVDLPGLEEKDVDVSVSGDVLTVRGERKNEREEERKGYYLSERSYGSFYRTVPLPPGVDRDNAKASFKNGVLTVTLPKTQEAQRQVKRIEVKAA